MPYLPNGLWVPAPGDTQLPEGYEPVHGAGGVLLGYAPVQGNYAQTQGQFANVQPGPWTNYNYWANQPYMGKPGSGTQPIPISGGHLPSSIPPGVTPPGGSLARPMSQGAPTLRSIVGGGTLGNPRVTPSGADMTGDVIDMPYYGPPLPPQPPPPGATLPRPPAGAPQPGGPGGGVTQIRTASSAAAQPINYILQPDGTFAPADPNAAYTGPAGANNFDPTGKAQQSMTSGPQGSGYIRVRVGNQILEFGTKDPALDQALRNGGIPIDPLTGNDMAVTPGVYGGYLFDGLPINVIAGEGWAPGQQAALDAYYQAGWRPGMPALADPPQLPDTDQNLPGDFGELDKQWTEQFQFDPARLSDLPGYQFRLREGEKGLERNAAARGMTLSGQTLKALERFRQDYASNEFEREYGRQASEFDRRYNISEQQRAGRFNRFATLADLGQVSAGNLQSAGQNFGSNAANITLGTAGNVGQSLQSAANARASGYVGRSNALTGGLSGGASSLNDILALAALYKR